MAGVVRLPARAASVRGINARLHAVAWSRSTLETGYIITPLRRLHSSDARESWDNVLEQRRRSRLEVAAAASKAPREASPEEHDEIAAGLEPDAASRAELERDALQLQLFAYPSHRAVPWATVWLILASGSLTAGMALYWKMHVCSSLSLEDLRARVQNFASALQACTVNKEALAGGELHRLILASVLQAGSAPSRILTDSCIFAFCGTLFERLHGAPSLLAFVVTTTVLSNALALFAQERYASPVLKTSSESDSGSVLATNSDIFITSTSGGTVALGVFCGLRYSRWAVWPGLPIPVSWLLAPLLVANVIAGRDYVRQLVDYRTVISDPEYESKETSESGKLDRLSVAVCLGACEGVAERARSECRPALDDVEIWQGELEHAAETLPPLPPDGAFWADVFGAACGAVLAVLSRGRL